MRDLDGLWYAPGDDSFYRLQEGASPPTGREVLRNASGETAAVDLRSIEAWKVPDAVATMEVDAHLAALEGAADAALRTLFPTEDDARQLDLSQLPDDAEAIARAIGSWLATPDRVSESLLRLAHTTGRLANGMWMVTPPDDDAGLARVHQLRELAEALEGVAWEFRRGVSKRETSPWAGLVTRLERALPTLAMDRELAEHRAALIRRTREAVAAPLDRAMDEMFRPMPGKS